MEGFAVSNDVNYAECNQPLAFEKHIYEHHDGPENLQHEHVTNQQHRILQEQNQMQYSRSVSGTLEVIDELVEVRVVTDGGRTGNDSPGMIIFSDIVESVMEEKDDVRDMAGGTRCLRRRCGLRRPDKCNRETLL
ncbi:hypothetical protein C0J52_04902 [Blattella germanica]|nr:hypothetical protein C0J52_04902 [Blattella germanica]